MVEIQAKIDADRKALESKKDMAEEERNKVKADLDKKESELRKFKWGLIICVCMIVGVFKCRCAYMLWTHVTCSKRKYKY